MVNKKKYIYLRQQKIQCFYLTFEQLNLLSGTKPRGNNHNVSKIPLFSITIFAELQ